MSRSLVPRLCPTPTSSRLAGNRRRVSRPSTPTALVLLLTSRPSLLTTQGPRRLPGLASTHAMGLVLLPLPPTLALVTTRSHHQNVLAILCQAVLAVCRTLVIPARSVIAYDAATSDYSYNPLNRNGGTMSVRHGSIPMRNRCKRTYRACTPLPGPLLPR